MSAGRAWHGTRTSLVLLLAWVSGCGRLLDSRDVRKRSSAMVLIEPAEEIVYYDNHDPRGRPELEGISYLVSASYPAAEVICQITQHLATMAGNHYSVLRTTLLRPRPTCKGGGY
jgi:hypothetical protein